MKKVGLVLEGGGQRGIFTSGVLDAFMEKGFEVPYVIGVSCGTCNGIDYVSQQPERTKKCMVDAMEEHPYLSVKNVFKKGYLFNMDLIFDEFPNKFYPFDFETYFNSKTRMLITVTDVLTGKPLYLEEKHSKRRLMAIARASASLPFIAPMVKLDGVRMLDGGIGDSIPVKKAMEDGFEHTIIISTKIDEYRKTINRKSIRLAKMKYKKYPEFVKAFETRTERYNETLDFISQLEKEGKAFVIRPRFDGVSRTERSVERLRAFYRHGYDYGMEIYDELMRWMEDKDDYGSGYQKNQ